MNLQDHYAPTSICYGCGPANEHGLQIKSVAPETVDAGDVIAHWRPKPFHEAFPGVLNGGIIGSILDCHSNWTAAWYIMNLRGEDHSACTVTAEYKIKILRPTPSGEELEMRSRVTKVFDKKDRVWVTAELIGGGKVCATCEGLFVAVEEGHPAYFRW